MHAIQSDSRNMTAYELLPQVFDKIEGTRWLRMYDNSLVSYGDLILVIDDFRMRILNDTGTGRPKGWPEPKENVPEWWDQEGASWNMITHLKKQLGTPGFIRDITATGASFREWIRFDRLSNQSEATREGNPPTLAHVSHAYAQRLDTASRIQLSLTFLIIVIVCNSVKLATMM